VSGLIEFLRARLDEDEAEIQRRWGPLAGTSWVRREPREVAAKRAILGLHHPTRPHPEFGFTYPAAANFCGYDGPGDNWQAEQEPDHFPDALWPCWTVRMIAAVYSDHPDYRSEWAPPPPDPS
jgi:hypothetical protein